MKKSLRNGAINEMQPYLLSGLILKIKINSDFQTINDIRGPSRKESINTITEGMENSELALKLKVNNILENS